MDPGTWARKVVKVVESGARGIEPDAPSPMLAKFLLTLWLTQIHKASGQSTDTIGEIIRYGGSSVGRWISGDYVRPLAPLIVGGLADAYDCEPAVKEDLIQLAEQAQTRNGTLVRPNGWLQTYRLDMLAALERSSRTISTYEPELIPGLCQTAGYAELVIRGAVRDDAGVAERVALRMERQQVLSGLDKFHVVMDESVLHRYSPDHQDVMAEQLAHLLATAKMRNVTLQVTPLRAGPPAVSTNAFILLKGDRIGHITYTATATTGTYVEDTEENYRYREVFDERAARALAPKASVALIANAFDEMKH